MKTAILFIVTIMTWLLVGCSSAEKIAIASWQDAIDRHFSSIEPYLQKPAVDKSNYETAEFPSKGGQRLYLHYGGPHPNTSVIGFNYWFVLPTVVQVDAVYLGRYDLGGASGDLFLRTVCRNTWHGTGATTVVTVVQPAFRFLSGNWIEGVNEMAAVHASKPPDTLDPLYRDDYHVIPAAQEIHIILRSPDLDWIIPAGK